MFCSAVSLQYYSVLTLNTRDPISFLSEFRPLIETRRDRQSGEVFEVLDGMMLKDGYMYKWVSNGSVVFWGVQPSESELLKFSNVNKDDSEDLDWVSSVYSGRKKVRLTDDSDNVATTSRKNEYKLHDLVLFGFVSVTSSV